MGICTNLKDVNSIGHESVIGESPIVTLLHDMMGDDPESMFPYHVGFRNFTTVSGDARFTYWLYDCLNSFEGTLKKAGIYEAIWASWYRQETDKELLKALMAR